jgi:sec-independent protein translocase protein TatA
MFSGLFQPMHMIIILVVVLVVFGPGKLPELGEGLAKGINSFKRGMKDLKESKDTTDKPEAATLEHKENKTA